MKKKSLGTVLRAAALAGTVLLGACVGDGDDVLAPRVPFSGGELFQRYVSLGNSITAGYQSDGINDSTQVRAYPVLLAERAGAQFFSPLVMRPGCPRPFRSPLGLAGRVTAANGDTTTTCARINNPQFVSNLAVPGERIGDLLNFPTTVNVARLHTLLVGPRTQLQAMADVRPSLVSVWIGNNDALQAGLTGNLALLTPTALFAARADSVLDAIQAANPRDAIVIGVVNPSIAPLLQPGAFYYLAYISELAAGRPSPFGRPVNANCAPGTAGGRRQVSLAIAAQPTSAITEVSCAYDAPLVLNEDEATTLTNAVNAFNTALQTGSAGRREGGGGYLYIDPMQILGPFVNDPARLRKCQGLATATTTAQFQAAVANTCPNLANPAIGFGNLMSFDGVHPSSAAHVIITNFIAAQLNTRHGLSLPTS